MNPVTQPTSGDQTSLRPFQVNIPETELTELRKRINTTRWPEKETVADFSQGVPSATIQKLARYWGTEYDWRKVEARMNAYPQFLTEIDGLDIHFLHIRSKHEGALPLDRLARMARLDHRTTQDHRAAHQPDRAWWHRSRCLPRGDPVDAGLRLLRQADHDGLGSPSESPVHGMC